MGLVLLNATLWYSNQLLDWTENPLQALHFAISKNDNTKTPCVWILDPVALNFTTHESDRIYVPGAFKRDGDINAWLPHRCCKDGEIDNTLDKPFVTNELPIAIFPSRSNPRLFNQRGTFTVHGTKPIALEDLEIMNHGTQRLNKIEINPSKLEELLDDLWTLGFNNSSTYPEPSMLSMDIKKMYNIHN